MNVPRALLAAGAVAQVVALVWLDGRRLLGGHDALALAERWTAYRTRVTSIHAAR